MLLRIEPDAHRVGRCEYLDIAHAGHAPQFVHDPRIGEIAEFQRARTSRIRTDCNQEEESRIGLLNRYTLPPDLFGQRSEEHRYDLQSLMGNWVAVLCLKQKNNRHTSTSRHKHSQ